MEVMSSSSLPNTFGSISFVFVTSVFSNFFSPAFHMHTDESVDLDVKEKEDAHPVISSFDTGDHLQE